MTRTRQKTNTQNSEKNSFMQTVKRFTQINVSLIEIDETFIKKTKSMKIEKIFEKKFHLNASKRFSTTMTQT